jgi:hypothetical protein
MFCNYKALFAEIIYCILNDNIDSASVSQNKNNYVENPKGCNDYNKKAKVVIKPRKG